jgi:hypothetical protein
MLVSVGKVALKESCPTYFRNPVKRTPNPAILRNTGLSTSRLSRDNCAFYY